MFTTVWWTGFVGWGVSVAPQWFIFKGMLWHILPSSRNCTWPYCDFNNISTNCSALSWLAPLSLSSNVALEELCQVCVACCFCNYFTLTEVRQSSLFPDWAVAFISRRAQVLHLLTHCHHSDSVISWCICFDRQISVLCVLTEHCPHVTVAPSMLSASHWNWLQAVSSARVCFPPSLSAQLSLGELSELLMSLSLTAPPLFLFTLSLPPSLPHIHIQ